MRFEDEKYVRLFTRDTANWVSGPWQARAVLPLITRKLDRAGMLDIGVRGLAGLAAVIQMPIEVVEVGVQAWLECGTFEIHEGTLVMPKFQTGQEAPASDAQRQREKRAKDRESVRLKSAPPAAPENEIHEASEKQARVTDGHALSRAVTLSCAVPSCALPNKEETDTSAAPPTDPPKSITEVPASKPLEAPVLLTHPEPKPARSPEREVFEHWVLGWRKAVRGTRPPVLDSKRRTAIQARLRDGFTVPDLKRACDGMWATPWNQGENPDGKRFNDIELVCRNASNVERFMAAAPPDSASSTRIKALVPEEALVTCPPEYQAGFLDWAKPEPDQLIAEIEAEIAAGTR